MLARALPRQRCFFNSLPISIACSERFTLSERLMSTACSPLRGSGYILWVVRFTPFPPNLIKRSLAPKNIGQGQPASLRPKGSLSLTRMLRKNYFDSFSIKILFLSIALSNNVEYFKTSIYNQPSWRLNLPAIFFAGLIT